MEITERTGGTGFGDSLAITANILLVGDPYNRVYLFERDPLTGLFEKDISSYTQLFTDGLTRNIASFTKLSIARLDH